MHGKLKWSIACIASYACTLDVLSLHDYFHIMITFKVKIFSCTIASKSRYIANVAIDKNDSILLLCTIKHSYFSSFMHTKLYQFWPWKSRKSKSIVAIHLFIAS